MWQAVVVGVSAGGLEALNAILPILPGDFPLPIAIVQHVSPWTDDYLPKAMNEKCRIQVKQADEKESLSPGKAYFAPPNYHLLIEIDRTFSLSVDERVNYARPSIDVLFESAAEAYGSELIGLVLTGANEDGSRGLRKIKDFGGFALVQDPKDAAACAMPQSALRMVKADRVAPLREIAPALISLCMPQKSQESLLESPEQNKNYSKGPA